MESSLHLVLAEKLNIEVAMGNVKNFDDAEKWLTKTFLFVRFQQNPTAYQHSDEFKDLKDQTLEALLCKQVTTCSEQPRKLDISKVDSELRETSCLKRERGGREKERERNRAKGGSKKAAKRERGEVKWGGGGTKTMTKKDTTRRQKEQPEA